MQTLSRRTFLRASGLAALGAIAAACSKKAPIVAKERTLDQLGAAQQPTYQLISTGTELLPGANERVAFALVNPRNGERFTDGTAELWIAKERTTPAEGPFPATYHGDGLGDRGVWETSLAFPGAGTYLGIVRATPPGAATAASSLAQFAVGRQTTQPKVGDKAPVVATPTFDDAHGVHPICTLKPRPCSMHDLSLDAALANGKPTLVIIATPQFCQSALCGPEVKIVDEVRPDAGGKVNFVHIEVYKDAKPATIQAALLSPAARAWKLDQEPAIYSIDPTGTIVGRTLGPVDRSDIRDLVAALAG